jgi:hypothetical protein
MQCNQISGLAAEVHSDPEGASLRQALQVRPPWASAFFGRIG